MRLPHRGCMVNIITPRPRYGATALRPDWEELPQHVHHLVSRHLGGEVTAEPSAGSGFTRGFAAVVHGAAGTQFVKAVSSVDSGVIADCYRREAEINRALPEAVPAPRLLWSEERDGWVVLGFEAVEGGRMPSEPWRLTELAASLDAYATLAEVLASPSPSMLKLGLKHVEASGDFDDWRALAGGTIKVDLLPAWVPLELLDALAELESNWKPAVSGHAVLHYDLRQDNVLIDAHSAAWICDWNWPCLGSSWFDLVPLLTTAHADGHDGSALFAAHPTGRGVSRDQLDAALAALSGFFLVSGAQPPPDFGSPFLRQHQTWSGEAALRWLADRRGWSF